MVTLLFAIRHLMSRLPYLELVRKCGPPCIASIIHSMQLTTVRHLTSQLPPSLWYLCKFKPSPALPQ